MRRQDSIEGLFKWDFIVRKSCLTQILKRQNKRRTEL